MAETQKNAAGGTTHFLKTPPTAGVPQLAVVFKPDGTKIISKEVATLTFLMPKTGHLRRRSYPFHRSFGNVVTKYLVLKTKRMLNQFVSSGKKAVFVMPVPNPAGYFGGLNQARTLRRYLQEVVFCLRVIKGAGPRRAKLAHSAVAGFSAAGTPLLSLMRTSSRARSAFPELKEIYALDVIANTVTLMNAAASAWLQTTGRRLRIYIAKFSVLEAQTPLFTQAPRVTSDEAKEWTDARSTWLYAPPKFWMRIRDEHGGAAPDPDYFPRGTIEGHQIHQIIPCMMLTHALATSGLP